MLNLFKNCIKIIFGIFCILVFIGVVVGDSSKDKKLSSSNVSWDKNAPYYVQGYLIEGAIWNLESPISGQAYINHRKTSIEIWKHKTTDNKGEKITQIYFLEGEYAGNWGWTPEKYTVKK